jgi:hypothetical protein
MLHNRKLSYVMPVVERLANRPIEKSGNQNSRLENSNWKGSIWDRASTPQLRLHLIYFVGTTMKSERKELLFNIKATGLTRNAEDLGVHEKSTCQHSNIQ